MGLVVRMKVTPENLDLGSLERIASISSSVLEALQTVNEHLGGKRALSLVYCFYVHAHSRSRSDAIIVATTPRNVLQRYQQQGGLATDYVAKGMDTDTEPFQFNICEFRNRLRAVGDSRYKFAQVLIDAGYKQSSVCPLVGGGVIGFGGLNQIYKSGNSKDVLPPRFQLELACQFHVAVRRSGLLAKEIGLDDRETETLKFSAEGRSAMDIAYKMNLSQRAIELRLQNIRKKLNALTTAEAIHKGNAYGVFCNVIGPIADESTLEDKYPLLH